MKPASPSTAQSLGDELAQKAARLEQINRELTDSEERLRLAIATGRIGLWIWNSTDIANAGDWSPRLKEIFGLPVETEVTHEIFLECVHEEDRARVNEGVMQALGGTAGGVYACEYRVRRKNDGALRWVTARGQAFFDAQGRPIRFIGTLMDIMERKQSESQGRQAAIVSERNRFARDIHDTLAQGFTGVIVQLEAAEDARSRGLDAESDAHLARARELAGDSLREARRSVQALRPQALTGQDLCAALTEMICKMTTGTALKGEFAVEGEPAPLPAVWEDHLLHLGQELLTNSVRHAGATLFKGQLAFARHTLRMEFSDNGRGFDPQQKADGFGLVGMKERVAAMNGELTIRSAPGEGCTVIIVLPLPIPNPDPHAAS